MNINFSDRVENLIKCPFRVSMAVVSGTENIVVGVTGIALSVLTDGNKRFDDMSKKLYQVKQLLPNVYKSILRVVKPDYPVADKLEDRGYLTEKIVMFIVGKGVGYAENNDGFIKKHIFSRAAMILGFIIDSITRVADLALGLLAASLSILAFGNVEEINTFAMQQLTFFGLIEDFCSLPFILFNPSNK